MTCLLIGENSLANSGVSVLFSPTSKANQLLVLHPNPFSDTPFIVLFSLLVLYQETDNPRSAIIQAWVFNDSPTKLAGSPNEA